MGLIRLLPDHLINRIAAGEVVQRPAAALKEMMENSLDAGASRIEVETEDGGRRLIKVADNGGGMAPDDLLLAVERHATSKLAEEPDLLRIETLGFRGEALPSIGAVSRLTVTSADGEDGRARRLKISGGKLLGVEDAARDRGTTVEVRDLFFNVPARRKFLKSTATEAAHCQETVERFALGRPDLRLVYRHNGQELLSTTPREDQISRLAKVLGRDLARAMFPFQGDNEVLSVSGFLGRPEVHRARGGVYPFVNGRPVADRLVTRAVIEAYQGRLPSRRSPVAVIFVEIPPEMVDVNVHPAKAEVLFRKPGEVFQGISEIIRTELSRNLRPTAPSYGTPAARPRDEYPRLGESGTWSSPPQPRPSGRPQPPPVETLPFSAYQELEPFQAPQAAPEEPAAPQAEPDPFPETFSPSPGLEAAPRTLKPIGQLYRSYILAQGPQGLFVVDQHAAHERILFEKFREELNQGHLPSQRLLLPETFDLSPTQAASVSGLTERLAKCGFDLEPFGGHTFVLRAVPAALAGKNGLAAIEDIARAAGEVNPQKGAEKFETGLLSSLACHAAVKAGDELSRPEMERLLADLDRTEVPTHCPHGRPLIFCLERRDIEKRFQRI